MIDAAKRLFVGIKISKALQHELDSPAPGTQHYFEGSDTNDFLQIISVGEQKFIGRYIKDGFPATQYRRREPQRMQHCEIDHPRPAHRGQ